MTSYEDLEQVVHRAAKSVAGQWPGIVDAEDVEQGLWEHLISRPNSIEKIRGMEDRAQYRAVVGIGHQIASQERTDLDYYRGSYTYSVKDAKDLLTRGVLTVAVDGFDAGILDLVEGLEQLVRRDIERVAKDQQPTRYAEAIVSRYADHTVPALKADQRRLENGMEALVRAMNQSARVNHAQRDDGVGTRAPVPAGVAQQASGSQYDGEYEIRPGHQRDSATEPEIWEVGPWR